MLQHADGQAFRTVGHCPDAQVGPVRDQRGHERAVVLRWRQEQRGISLLVCWVSQWWPQVPRESAVRIDLHQELLNTDAREVAAEQLAQDRRAFGFTVTGFPTEAELATFNPGKGIRGKPLLHVGGGLVKLPDEGLHRGRALWWEVQRVHGRFPGLLPCRFVIAETPK